MNENKETINSENFAGSWFQKKDALVAAFLVPVFILLVIFAQRGVYPFGKMAFLRMDCYHQYAPFLSELHHKLTTGESLLYSWDVGMGVNFASLYAYYLASPLNWLIALFPQQYIIEFIEIMILLKTGLSGLTMAAYLNKHSETSKISSALFGVFYALSGYMISYNWNIMWLDCIVLMPLIIMALERLITEKKGVLYAFLLGICIISNSYISIMICIFLVLYFILYSVVSERTLGEFVGAGFRFALYSILAGCMAAFLILPFAYTLQMSASAESVFPETIHSYFAVIDVLARQMMNVESELGLDHWPNIYCGVAVMPLFVMWLVNRKIGIKEKIAYLLILAVFIASFSIDALNFLWHGYHFPNSLPARHSFIYILLVLFVSFRALDNLDGNRVKDIGLAVTVSLVFIFLCEKVCKDDAFKFTTFLLSAGFVSIYALILYLIKTGKANINLLTFLALAVVAVEAEVNGVLTIGTVVTRSRYTRFDVPDRAVVATIDDTDFYRVDITDRDSKDQGAWLNIPTMSIFSSTAKEGISDFTSNLGCESSINFYSIKGATPLVDSLLNIKYSVYSEEQSNEELIPVARYEETYLYENPSMLPLGYMIGENFARDGIIDSENPVEVQNYIAEALSASPLLRQATGFTEDDKYSVTIPKDGEYYILSGSSKTDKILVEINEEEQHFENVRRRYLLELGTLKKGDIVDISSEDKTALNVGVYRFHYESLTEIAEVLGKSPMEVKSFDETHISATVNAAEDGILFTSIPYDEGWRVLVDGEEVMTEELWDSFLVFDLKAGYHTVEFTFFPVGLKEGAIISAAATVLLLLIGLIGMVVDIQNNNYEKVIYEVSEERRSDTDGGAAPGCTDSIPPDSQHTTQ